jgi:osmotically-inducible protein OsmY
LFGREPFTYGYEPRYFGTGNPGWGGTGFTGGAYTFGEEAPEIPRTYELEADQGLGYYQAGYYQPGYDPMASEGGSRWSGRGSQGGFSSSQGGFRGGDPRTGPGMFRGRGPKGYQRSDERLREDISERIMQAYHIDSSEVTVEVRGGKVVLEGTVPDRRMKHAIEDLADAAPGVQDIENRIRVQSSASGAGTMSRPVGSATAGSAAGSPGSTGTTGAGSSAAGSGSAGTGSTGAGTSGRTTRKE